ncbi:MAG: hypothetical protein FWC03_10920 [Treponema sp.]|nr:hypothetical protein [Treponema sp.]
MSYSKSYHASVPYSGTVSYGPSQNGGTKSYSGSVPVDITINVNTAPFDGSINKFNTSVIALGGSVAAMNAAQCIAIKKTADEISASLIKGFFGTISTELSQQIQALSSAINAGLGLIHEQSKAVTEKKGVMEGDYNRITGRYIKLFSDLDDECFKRIYALDKPSFNISKNVIRELISESSCNAAAMNLLGIDEASSSKMCLFVSALNRKTLEILRTMHSYINQESSIKSMIDSLLFNDELGENIPLYIPVIWSESDTLESQGTDQNCFITNDINQQEKKTIADRVKNFCRDINSAKWKPADEPEKEMLNREFNLLAETQFAAGMNAVTDETTQQRVYKTMMSLWQNTEISSLERSL